ncbi:MAG: histidine phosphatase family protein [Clostridia bacterium]|nr:histidine phosphatase family protein [Clostridia bacterium]
MILYLVRHGKTEYNTVKRYTGNTDVPLSSEGISQARETALLLKDVDFDVIVSSPLLRARKTAEIIAEYHPSVPVVFMDGLRERSFGDWEGKEYSDRSYIDFICLPENIFSAPDNGETIAVFYERVKNTLDEIKYSYPSKTVLAVAHGMVSRMINKAVNDIPFGEANKFLLPNCGYIRYEL